MFIIRLAAEALSIADSHPSKVHQTTFPTKSTSEGGSNFLYKLLSGQEDASTAQQRSELSSSSINSDSLYWQQQKQRSNSVIVHRNKVNYVAGDKRPSSVPQSTRYMPYPHPKKLCREVPTRDYLPHSRTKSDSPAYSVSTDSGLDEPLDLTKQPITDCSDSDSFTSSPPRCGDIPLFALPPPREEYVQLARKMARPVQSRVSEWLRQMVSLVAARDETSGSRLCELPADLRLRLLQASWHRVLLLYMAEHNLRIVTSPLHESPGISTPKSSVKPTQKFAEQVDELINLCSAMPFDHSTYDLIRIAVILMGKKQNLDSTNLDLLSNYLTTRADVVEFRSVMSKLVEMDKGKVEALFCGNIDQPVEQFLSSLFYQSNSLC